MLHQIIKRPLITEKNTFLSSQTNQKVYVFEVNREADKLAVKSAVEKAFRVKVDSVRTSLCRYRAQRNKFKQGRVFYWKKAYVKLAQGEKIALLEGV